MHRICEYTGRIYTLMKGTFIGDRQCVDYLILSDSHAFISLIIITTIAIFSLAHELLVLVARQYLAKLARALIITNESRPLAFKQDTFIFLTAYFSYSLIRHAEISKAEISCRCAPLHVYDVKRIRHYHMFTISMSVSMFHARPIR